LAAHGSVPSGAASSDAAFPTASREELNRERHAAATRRVILTSGVVNGIRPKSV
jgi:hypothetical protein